MKLYFFLGFVLILIFANKFKQNQNNNNSPSNDVEKLVPIIHVFSEDPDRDPLDLKRNYEEKIVEKERNKNIAELEKSDKFIFQNLLVQQNELQEKLNSLSNNSKSILNDLVNNPSI
jgi:hypothetical protein